MTDTVTLTLANADHNSPVERSVPRRLGPVVLECEIGRGAMGVVFRGRHEILGRSVAVKLLLYALRGEEDPHFDRFRGEARMAAAVRHPNLTMIHHADVVDGVPYLVMDYIDGPSLGAVIRQSGALPIDAALAAALAMTDAVAALHASGIVHRDIKTKNTLLDRDGNVFVTDFGLALARERRGPSMAPFGVAGTPNYMAPEMFDGLVSPRSDVYALGITTFELLTGSPPFSGSLAEVQKQHVGSPLPVAALEDLGVAPAIIDVLERATHKNATFRYKSADHYRQALEAVTEEAQRAAGRAALKDLAARFVAVEPPPAVDPPTSTTPTTNYFDLLGQIADQKRQRADKEPGQESFGSSQTGEPPSSACDVPQSDATRGFKSGTLRVDLPCVKCRYNLRGLDVATRCPECGEPISSSAGPPRLMFADPKWLARVQRGLTLIVAAPAVTLFCGIFIFPLIAWTERAAAQAARAIAAGQTSTTAPFVSIPSYLGLILFLGVIVLPYMLATVGLFFATARDTSALEKRRLTFWRCTARVGACLAVGATGLQFVRFVQSLGSSISNTFNVITPVTSVGAFAAGAGLFFWLEHLAARNLDTNRATNARTAVVAWACGSLASVLLNLPLLRTWLLESDVFIGGIVVIFVVAGPCVWIVASSFRRLVKQERRLALALGPSVGESTVTVPSTAAASQETAISPDPATPRPVGPDDPRRILRLQRCPQCDYDLRTLPEEHRCPECGFAYDRSTFAVNGLSKGERYSVAGRLLMGTWVERLLAVLISTYFVYVVAVGAYNRWQTVSGMSDFMFFCGRVLLSVIFVIFVIGGIELLISHFRRSREERWATIQLLFTKAGASKRRGPGEPRFVPWKRFRRLRFRKLRSIRAGKPFWRLRLTIPFFRYLGWEPFEAFIECTPREAALVRAEIRRRLQAAKRS